MEDQANTSQSQKSQKTKARRFPVNGKHDLNLALRACFVLSRRNQQRKIVRRWKAPDANGKTREFELEIKAPDRLPWYRDNETLMALITISLGQGGVREIRVSGYEVLRLLGLTDGKENYEYLARSIDRLVATTIKGTFWSTNDKTWYTRLKWDSLIHSAEMAYEVDEETGQTTSKGLHVRFGDIVWTDIQSGNLSTFDWDEYHAIEGGDSVKALYQYMNAVRATKWETDIFQLWETHLGGSHYQYPSQIWKKLQPILERAKRQGLLKSYRRVKRGKYTRVVLEKAPKKLPAKQSVLDEETVPDPDDELAVLWHEAKRELEGRMSKGTFSMWIHPTDLVALTEHSATLSVPNRFAKDWIENRLAPKIKETLNGLGHPIEAFEFEVRNQETDEKD